MVPANEALSTELVLVLIVLVLAAVHCRPAVVPFGEVLKWRSIYSHSREKTAIARLETVTVEGLLWNVICL